MSGIYRPKRERENEDDAAKFETYQMMISVSRDVIVLSLSRPIRKLGVNEVALLVDGKIHRSIACDLEEEKFESSSTSRDSLPEIDLMHPRTITKCNCCGFLPPIELSFEIESIKPGPLKTLRYYAAFLQGLAWQLNRKK